MSDITKNDYMEQLHDELLLLTSGDFSREIERLRNKSLNLKNKAPFFSRFSKMKTKEEVVYESTFISLHEFANMLGKSMHKFVSEKESITEAISDNLDYNEVVIEDGILNVLDSEGENVYLSVDLKEKPKLIKGKESTFEEIKSIIYDLKFTFQEYSNFKNNIEKFISLTEMSNIDIVVNEDMTAASITLKIGNIGILEIRCTSTNSNYNTEVCIYSDDINVNRFLRKNYKELIELIEISRLKISNFLKEYNEIKEELDN